jgi:VWFA-related protein
MKKYLTIILIMILNGWVVFPVLSPAQVTHDKIIEKIKVGWWQVPVLAIDSSGNAVTDLSEKDIQLRVNGKLITDFVFFKRAFSSTQESQQQATGKTKELAPAAGKQVVLLLFDLAMSGRVSVKRSKTLAKTIIKSAAPGTHFIVMTIEPFAGLNFICQNKDDKKDLLKRIKKKVIGKENPRIVSQAQISLATSSSMDGIKDHEGEFFMSRSAMWHKRRTSAFFKAFKTLYFHLSGLEGNKFIYFFSEGISNSIRDSLRGEYAQYNDDLKETAKNLARCGGVFFLINTRGVDQYTSNRLMASQYGNQSLDSVKSISGEDSLQILANESGGKYMEGSKKTLAKYITNINRVFYEISFRNPPGQSISSREIKVTCKRKDITIISLRSVETMKSYRKMSKIEKELLAVNLVTGNPLVKKRITPLNARIKKTEKKEKEIIYRVKIPKTFLMKKLDLYKLWVDHADGVAEIIKIKKKQLELKTDTFDVRFKRGEENEDKSEDEIQARKENSYERKTLSGIYFVLVEPISNQVRVHGMEEYEADLEIPTKKKY